MSARNPSTLSIAEIQADFRGPVIGPLDERYDSARAVFYGGIDKRPAMIIRASGADDVQKAVKLAGETGLELAVRSGGHSNAGHSVSEGGIVLDLGGMCTLLIDPRARTAWVEPGMRSGEYTNAAAEHNLATGFGDTASVGIGGLTLGGGVGYLVRKHGLTIDSLLAADIVTADGQLLRLDADSNPDLFWAIRGGGGNFGVVTRLQFKLHPVDSVLGGMLILPATPDVIADFIAEAEAAPDELSTIANVFPAPPMPFLPEDVHGKMVVMAMLVHVGDPSEGERLVGKFRKLATPYADMVKPMRFPEIYPPEDPSYHPLASSRTMFVDSIDRKLAERIIDRLMASTGTMAVAQLRVLGGAMARVPADATAFAHRKSRIMANLAALYESLEEKPTHEAWVTDFQGEMQQGDYGAYVNFLGDEGPERVRAAYPSRTWERLSAVKKRYDPDNVFHLNQNILPVTQRGKIEP